MKEKWVIRDIRLDCFYSGKILGFSDNIVLSERFDTVDAAKATMLTLGSGIYEIVKIYLVDYSS